MSVHGYSPQSYASLLELLRAHGYHFADFREPPAGEERVVYLRHDVDYSPEWALALARINSRFQAMGTFFFRLRSPIYNLHAYSTLAVVREICELGQVTGLHYDIEPGPEAIDAALVARVGQDHAAARVLIPELAPVFNWHNPSLAPNLLERGLDLQVPGLINTYGRSFVERVKYYSDSNLRHTVKQLEEIIGGTERQLQLLLHPFQWLAGGEDMQEVLANTWKQVLREKEQEFLTNHVYRKLLPDGIPQPWLDEFARRLAAHGK